MEAAPQKREADFQRRLEGFRAVRFSMTRGLINGPFTRRRCAGSGCPPALPSRLSPPHGPSHRGFVRTGEHHDLLRLTYPVAAWNQNLTLEQAFQSSCVWYFRQVIDQVGRQAVAEQLAALSYGNQDISQWAGSGQNQSQELNGFWIDSS